MLKRCNRLTPLEIFENCYIIETRRLIINHCYQRIDLPVKKGPLLIYGCDADLLHFFAIKSEYAPMFIM